MLSGDAAGLRQWSARGEFAVQTAAHAETAWWRWDQAGAHRRLVVLGPLGRVVLTMTAEPGKVRVASGNGRQYRGSRARPLVERLTGWRLPTADLSYWLRGVPRPGHAARFQRVGGIQVLEQDGWQVQFLRFAPVQGLSLPQRLVLTWPSPAHPQIRLRLFIQQWRIAS